MAYAVAVADEGGFSAAARRLDVAQPSVSQAVAQLERELGARLFDRIGRRVVVTAAGEALLAPARRMLREARAAQDAVAAVGGLAAGHLDLVALPTVATDPVAGLIGSFRGAYPGIQVRVAEPDTADEAWSVVAAGLAELAFAEAPKAGHDLLAQALFAQELVVVAPPGHPLETAGVRPAELARWPLIAPPPGTSTRRLLDGVLAAVGHRATIAVETAQRESIVPLVLAGAGVALLPEATARRAAASGAVVARLRPALVRTLGIVHRRGALSPAAQAFVDLAAASLGSARERGSDRPGRAPRLGPAQGTRTSPGEDDR